MDDISALRQFSPEIAAGQESAHLFAPQITYRVRRNNNTDTPLPPEEPAGQNPPDGAMIDYWLSAKGATSAPVILEILDASSGKVVRRFSSADKPQSENAKELNVPTYWVRPAKTLSAAPGMHRFIWNLSYPEPDVLEHAYPISAIFHDTPRYSLGAAVLPGQYRVVLTANGKSYTQALEIRMDPRVKTSPEDLRRQFELAQKIADALRRDYEALKEVRSLRAQLKPLAGNAAVGKTVGDLEAKAALIEGEDGMRYFSTPEGRSLTRVNGGLNTLVSGLDSADAAPTTQQAAVFVELEKALQEQLTAWEQIKSRDIVELNEQLKKVNLPLIDLQKPVMGRDDLMETTTQDRDKNEE